MKKSPHKWQKRRSQFCALRASLPTLDFSQTTASGLSHAPSPAAACVLAAWILAPECRRTAFGGMPKTCRPPASNCGTVSEDVLQAARQFECEVCRRHGRKSSVRLAASKRRSLFSTQESWPKKHRHQFALLCDC